jgi:hypothetical protein
MSPKSFVVLVAATAVSVGLAAYAVLERHVPATAGVVGAPLAPALASRLDEVGKLVIEKQGQTVTVERRDGRWVLAERGGYPVAPVKVRDLVLAVSEARLLEPKTSNPERLMRLELMDPAAPEARSTSLRILAGDGEELAAVVIGKTRHGLYGAGRGGAYVRAVGSDQAWLADRTIEVPGEPVAWLERTVLDLPPAAVTGITLSPPTGEPVALVPEAGPEGRLTLASVPEGRAVDPEKVNRVRSLLDGLGIQDVQPASAVALPTDASRARFALANGAAITVTAARIGEGDKVEWWARLEVGDGAAARPGTPVSPAGTPTAAQPAVGEAAPADQAAAPPASPAIPSAEELKGKLEGWAFKLPAYLAERVGWTTEEFLKPAESTS